MSHIPRAKSVLAMVPKAGREETTRAKKVNLQKKGAEHHGLSKVMSNLESKN